MVGADGQLPLPWLDASFHQARAQGGSHALLIQGPEGVGQFELALALAQAHLCESKPPSGRPDMPCGVCPSCRLFFAHTHPDLMVVLPDAMREDLGWRNDDAAFNEAAVNAASRAKPSKEIRVDDIRAVIAFAQSTSARGRGKVVVLHQAERMNPIASNALLKTLEEPVGQTRFVLSSAAPEALLPTVRSRCRAFGLNLPPEAQSLAWLEAQGVHEPAVLLGACGGRPTEALAWARLGLGAPTWLQLPNAVAHGNVDAFMDWPLARVVDALQKLCHDSLCAAVGVSGRYFPALSLGNCRDTSALTAWAAQLRCEARQCEHPWNSALKVEALVQQAQRALSPSGYSSKTGNDRSAFVHSAS